MAFASQALCVEDLVHRAGELADGVHRVPEAIDQEIARLKLACLDVRIDRLSDEQRAYLHSWEQGT
jgi:adenosylhomocysteinase